MGGVKGDGKTLEVDSVSSPPLEPGISILLFIDCVVLTSSSEATETSQQLQLRVQGKEKHQMLEISLSPVSRKNAAHAPPLCFAHLLSVGQLAGHGLLLILTCCKSRFCVPTQPRSWRERIFIVQGLCCSCVAVIHRHDQGSLGKEGIFGVYGSRG